MTDPDSSSSFRFQWGNINLEVKGDADLVEQGFDLLKNEVLVRIDEEAPVSEVPAESDETPEVEADGAEKERETPTASEYLDEKNPSSNIERAIVLAHFAKTYRDQETLTPEQLERLINEAHIPMFSASDALYNASRSSRGWTERVATGTYELTPAGENYVQTQLPPDDE